MDDINTQPQPQPQWQAPRPRRGIMGLSARAATALTAMGLMAGGVAGGFLVTHAATSTDTSSSSSSATAPGTPGNGTFTPNEDPSHEAGESAAREAQENAGQRPTVP